MTDARVRERARGARTDQERAVLLNERLRTGQVTPDQVRLLAVVGHAPARLLDPQHYPTGECCGVPGHVDGCGEASSVFETLRGLYGHFCDGKHKGTGEEGCPVIPMHHHHDNACRRDPPYGWVLVSRIIVDLMDAVRCALAKEHRATLIVHQMIRDAREIFTNPSSLAARQDLALGMLRVEDRPAPGPTAVLFYALGSGARWLTMVIDPRTKNETQFRNELRDDLNVLRHFSSYVGTSLGSAEAIRVIRETAVPLISPEDAPAPLKLTAEKKRAQNRKRATLPGGHRLVGGARGWECLMCEYPADGLCNTCRKPCCADCLTLGRHRCAGRA